MTTEDSNPRPDGTAAEPLALRLNDQLGGWQPMRKAPRDGTAVLVLMDGSDIPHAVRWLTFDDDRATAGTGWYMTWDNYKLRDSDGPRYWMHCPDDPDA